MAFRYPCFREFKLYVGQVSAVYELLEIAVRSFEETAEKSENPEKYIDECAARFGVHVHFASCPALIGKVISLQIVNVHEALERFLKALRDQATKLLGLEWKDLSKKDTLYTAIHNVFGSQEKGKEVLGEALIDLCNYYRLIRNATIHSDRDPGILDERFAEVQKYREWTASQYETIVMAPNAPDALSRDDFQLFVRVAQDVAWGFSKFLRPTDPQIDAALKEVVASFTLRWPKQPERVCTAVENYLQKQYGYSVGDAGTIAGRLVH